MTDRRVHVGGVDLHLDDRHGAGTPVVVLHGFTGSGESMAPVVTALAASGRHTVAPDLVGHGRSTTHAPPECFTMDACVRQITDALDVLDIDHFHLVGYSMGGRLALSIVAAHPRRIRSLCLIGASPGLAAEVDRAARRRADDELARSIVTGGLGPFIDRWTAQPLFAGQAERLGDAEQAAARRQREHNDPHGLAASLRGMGTGSMPPLHQRLAAVAVPAVLMAGADDSKFCEIGRSMAAVMADARFVVVPDAGHAAHIENPAAVNAALADLLHRTDPL